MPDPITITASEAIAKVGPLMVKLIERSKEREAAAMVNQIQLLNQTIHTAYFACQEESANLRTKVAALNEHHFKEVAALNAAHQKAILELRGEDLTPDELAVLTFMDSIPDRIGIDEILRSVPVNRPKLRYVLGKLREGSYINEFPTKHPMFEILQKGREAVHNPKA